MNKITLGILAMLAIIFLSGASCTRQQPTDSGTPAAGNEQASIRLMTNDKVGEYFADANGMALYIFTKDTADKSVCEGQCLVNWPIFYTDNLVLPSGLTQSDFGQITHPTGAKMLTYKGWPLYYYIGDKASGDINGEGVGDVWYVVKRDYMIAFATDSAGNYLVDEKGMTLYYFTNDSKDKSVCEGQCLVNWPAFKTSNTFVPTTITNKADFGEITRSDGSQQKTFKGWPLYYYVKDKVRGDKLGQGLNNVWYTVDPEKLGAAMGTGNTRDMSFFVTSVNPGKGGNLGGLSGADNYCKTLATAAGAGDRNWSAYLSVAAIQNSEAINARDRIGTGPWKNFQGVTIATSVAELHDKNNINKQTALDEKGEIVSGRGDAVNRHDMLTGSTPDGRAIATTTDTTCGNWTSGDMGAAMLGHHDRVGTSETDAARSWNSSHYSQGCSLDALKKTGSAGLFYCFAQN